MPNISKANKTTKSLFMTGQSVLILRKKLKLNQSEFWNRIKVTQPGGSHYETGRKLPAPVQLLLHLAYAPTAQADAMLNNLRFYEKPTRR